MPTDALIESRGWGARRVAGSGLLYRAAHIRTMKHAGMSIATRAELIPIWTALLDRLLAAGLQLNGKVDDWSYADRAIRNGTAPSYHAWGLALDVDALANPSVTPGRPHTSSMPGHTADICRALSPRLVWGGTWTDPYDPMHFEWQGTLAEAKALAAALRGKRTVTAATSFPAWYRRQLTVGARGADVTRLQTFLRTPADGVFGPRTEQALRAWQKQQHLGVDGVFGRVSARRARQLGA